MPTGLFSEIASLTIEHLELVLVAMLIASAIAIPTGVYLTRRAGMRGWVLGFANVLQTIPSLALFGFLIPVPLIGGIGRRTAIVALVLYALLPVLRNTLVGILGVDAAVRESAVAMGMTRSEERRVGEECRYRWSPRRRNESGPHQSNCQRVTARNHAQ